MVTCEKTPNENPTDKTDKTDKLAKSLKLTKSLSPQNWQ